jgi:CRP/FNR family cyclic AMP-dependent transcriptional regulator
MNEDIDIRSFARGIGINHFYKAGSIVFNEGDPGGTLYVVQSGVIEMVSGELVIEVVTANGAIGLLSVVDRTVMSSTARVKEDVELTLIDQRRFQFMIDELPNFPMYLLKVLTKRIRSMGQIIA